MAETATHVLRRADVLAYLQRQVSLGKPFPSAPQIAARFGLKLAAPAQHALQQFARDGHLVCERIPDHRRPKCKYVYRMAEQKETANG